MKWAMVPGMGDNRGGRAPRHWGLRKTVWDGRARLWGLDQATIAPGARDNLMWARGKILFRLVRDEATSGRRRTPGRVHPAALLQRNSEGVLLESAGEARAR
jgi:hypothetical protein